MEMLTLVLIFVVLIAMLFLIFKMAFKIASNLKIFGLSVVVSIIIGAIGMVIFYMNGINYNLLGKSDKYVSGQVVRIDNNQITLRVIEHNINEQDLINKNVTVKTNFDTVVKKQEKALFESDMPITDISRGHRVYITCYYNKKEFFSTRIEFRNLYK